ncbi:MAG: hypothetical protein HYT31_04160 [Parcubacteria group bacterium]|nr:hypothetical protein [Parcubacteria group bacterium]
MKLNKIILAVIIFVALVLVLLVISRNDEETPPPGQPAATWETKTDERPPVTVTVTPVEFGSGSKTWKFDVVFDTHSGSLDDNILTAASLIDDKGNAYQPISWEGPGPGGHHREGVLVFSAVKPVSSFIELKIKNVGGVAERLFRWSLK